VEDGEDSNSNNRLKERKMLRLQEEDVEDGEDSNKLKDNPLKLILTIITDTIMDTIIIVDTKTHWDH